MPSYVSHTIMARDVYKKIDSDKVSLDYMLTFSLGGDLTKFSKVRTVSHRLDKRELFFNNLVEYIVNHNLFDNKQVLGFLYGHICHYAFDDTVHPLVRVISKSCKTNMKNHALLEFYYDEYLVNKKYNVPLNKYDNKNIFKGKVNKEIKNMIDFVYFKTYGIKHISRYYKFNLFLYRKIRYIYKIVPYSLIKKVIHLDKFLDINKDIDLFNNKHKIKYLGLNKKEISLDFDLLYKESIKKAVKDIEKSNKNMVE